MPDDPRLFLVLADFAAVAESAGVRWYLFGARAVAMWGAIRSTLDVDITVELVELPTRALLEMLGTRGFEPRFPVNDDFVERAHVLPLQHVAAAMPVDVVLAGPGFEEAFLDSARPVRFGDLVIPTISPEDLIVTKLLAARSKDLDDVDAVLRAQGDHLDWERIRTFLGHLEVALGQSDLLPALDAAIERTRRTGPP